MFSTYIRDRQACGKRLASLCSCLVPRGKPQARAAAQLIEHLPEQAKPWWSACVHYINQSGDVSL